MKIQKIIIAVLYTTLFSKVLSAQTATTIVGKWKDEKDANKQIEIYQDKDGLYYGKNFSQKDTKENKVKPMLKKCKYEASTQTFIGTMNPPDVNMDINVTISFLSMDKLKLVAKKLFMTKTIYFIRIK
jgi:hypothetical protein